MLIKANSNYRAAAWRWFYIFEGVYINNDLCHDLLYRHYQVKIENVKDENLSVLSFMFVSCFLLLIIDQILVIVV